jgi:hypothetical protein
LSGHYVLGEPDLQGFLEETGTDLHLLFLIPSSKPSMASE